ncbi:MAG TPA: MotA/TolQ/ExbB proton channel family protein [Bacillota bacterium]|nr:MotA/TolQ/ExbB proton channel family protein [Bacillota bacterium]
MKKSIVPIIAVFGGLAIIIYAIGESGGTFYMFWSLSSIFITIFGSLAALFISFPMRYMRKIPRLLKQIFSESNHPRTELVALFADLARRARKEGLLSLEDEIENMEDPFLIKGLQMVVDGMEPKMIGDILDLEMDAIDEEQSKGVGIFRSWGDLAPAFGMVGTLIGLIIMLADLQDMDAIGTGMATALITTFYGSLLANLIFIPFANNLRNQKDEELHTKEMMVEGILSIQSGVNPRIVEERLSAYLSPEERFARKEAVEKIEQLDTVVEYE